MTGRPPDTMTISVSEGSAKMEQDNRFLRQLDICPPEKLAFPIVVIGAGAIGSATVVTLVKMGCSLITVWDDDMLEEHNASNQLCRLDAIGRPKVEALALLTQDLTAVSIKTRPERYKGQRLEGVVIAAVDSMTSRQEVWKRARFNPAIPLLVDARMGAEVARIYTIHSSNPEEVDFYEANLYPQDEAERLPCSARAIIYCPAIVAGLIALLVKSHAMGGCLAREILLDLPTLTLISETLAHQLQPATTHVD